MVLEFDKSKALEYSKIAEMSSLAPEQEKLMTMFITLLSKNIPSLSDMVMKGLFRMSVKEFVKETGTEAKVLMEKPIAEVATDIRKIFDIMNNKLGYILRRREDIDLLKQKVDETYQSLINKRKEMESQQN